MIINIKEIVRVNGSQIHLKGKDCLVFASIDEKRISELIFNAERSGTLFINVPNIASILTETLKPPILFGQ